MIYNPKRVMAYGWWQGRNFGDNWIASNLRKAFGDIGFMPTEGKVETEFLIYGGGGLFMEELPPLVSSLSVPYGMLGIGAEFKTLDPDGVQRVVDKSEFFFVRDQHTVDSLGIGQECLSADLTFYEPLYESKRGTDIFLIWRDINGILSARPSFSNYIGNVPNRREWIEALGKHMPVKISEFKASGPPLKDYKLPHGVTTSFGAHGSEIHTRLRNMGVIVSARYHGLVAAIQASIPCIGIDICPKIRALMNESGLGDYCLKIGETSRIPEVMSRLKDEQHDIRQKQQVYTINASSVIRKHVEVCKEKIGGALNV